MYKIIFFFLSFFCTVIHGASIQSEQIENVILTKNHKKIYQMVPLLEDNLLQDPQSDPLHSLSLNEETDRINIIFKKFVIQNEEIDERYLHKISRELLRVLAVSFGGVAGIPFINVAKEAAGSSEYLQWLYVFGTVVSSGISSSWVLNNIVTSLELEPLFLDKKSTPKDQRFSFLKHLAINTISILDSVPLTYVAYTHNDNKLYSIIVLLSDYGFKSYGYYKLIEDMYSKKIDKSDSIRSYLISLAKESFPIILSLKKDERHMLLQELYENEEITITLFTKKLITLIKKHKTVKNEHKAEKTINTSFQVLASPLYIANSFTHAILAYNGMMFATNSTVFSGFSSCTSTISSFYLNYFATRKTIDSISSSFFTNTHNANFTSTFFPSTKYFSPLVSLAIVGLSYGSFGFIFYDTLNHSFLQKAAMFFTITSVIGGVIMESFAMRDTIDKIIMFFSQYKGTKEQSKLLEVKKSLERFCQILSNLTPEELAVLDGFLQENLYNFSENSDSGIEISQIDDTV